MLGNQIILTSQLSHSEFFVAMLLMSFSLLILIGFLKVVDWLRDPRVTKHDRTDRGHDEGN